MSTTAAITEAISVRYADLDVQDDETVLTALAEGQERAVVAARAAIPAIAAAAGLMTDRLAGGGRLIYVGAGSSAGVAVQDGSELPGTFGFARDRIVFLIAGGLSALTDIDGAAEDDIAAARADIATLGPLDRDVVVAVSASGSTPFTLAAAEASKMAGAALIGIANNAGTPLLTLADRPIFLDSGPEVVAGSTRMAAGTAQKTALGLLSTLVAVRLGHVHGGMMVGVRADNAKLRERARRIIGTITGAHEEAAARAIEASGGDVKAAVLICAGADAETAARVLAGTEGNLRRALATIAPR